MIVAASSSDWSPPKFPTLIIVRPIVATELVDPSFLASFSLIAATF